MADDADITGDRIDHYEADAVAKISKAASHRQLIPVCRCYNCGEEIQQHHIFCSSECSVDHRHREERRKANGQ